MRSEDYLTKAAKRAQQKAQLLMGRIDFQDDMKKLRAKWSIPKDGIKGNKASEAWHRWLNQITDEYQEKEWPQVRKKVIKLKTHGEFSEGDKLEKKFNAAAPLNVFQTDIRWLIKKYRLPPLMTDAVRSYLLFNRAHNLSSHPRVAIQHSVGSNGAFGELYLIINADTTLEDIKSFWPMVKGLQKYQPDYRQAKRQPLKNLKRDQRAYELRESKKTYGEIAKILSQEYKKIFTYSDIPSLIKRHKKRLGII